jgi:hypothetical protein
MFFVVVILYHLGIFGSFLYMGLCIGVLFGVVQPYVANRDLCVHYNMFWLCLCFLLSILLWLVYLLLCFLICFYVILLFVCIWDNGSLVVY